MKQPICILLSIFISVSLFSQTPQLINYQAIARDNAGNPIAGQNVTATFKIHQGSPSGSVIFQESQSQTTDACGMFNLKIGAGNPTSFGNINWASGSKFLEVIINNTTIGTTEMVSVPYALYAKKVETESQTLSINGSQLSISSGNTVTLPGGGSSVSQQILPHPGSQSADFKTVSYGNGSFLVLYAYYGSATVYKRDPITAQYLLSSADGFVNAAFGVAWLNDFIYYITKESNVVYLKKISINNQGKIIGPSINMNVIGTTLNASQLFSDGQYLYAYNSGNSWTKLSISGNDAINAGTWIGGINENPRSVFSENGYVYMLDNDSEPALSIYALSGNLISSKKINNKFYGADNPVGALYIDNEKCYTVSFVHNDQLSTNNYSFFVILTPVSVSN